MYMYIHNVHVSIEIHMYMYCVSLDWLYTHMYMYMYMSWYHQRSLTHHSQFWRLGIQCPTLVYVMFVGMKWVSFLFG